MFSSRNYAAGRGVHHTNSTTAFGAPDEHINIINMIPAERCRGHLLTVGKMAAWVAQNCQHGLESDSIGFLRAPIHFH